MPQQLIYTSAPRGLVAGRSGYCTVARSATMREALMLRLEQFSYYDHLSLVGGTERPVLACRVIDLRGTRYHVLSRIQDAGLDFTGRTNFIAHHLVVTPEEVSQMPTPAMAFRKWADDSEICELYFFKSNTIIYSYKPVLTNINSVYKFSKLKLINTTYT